MLYLFFTSFSIMKLVYRIFEKVSRWWTGKYLYLLCTRNFCEKNFKWKNENFKKNMKTLSLMMGCLRLPNIKHIFVSSCKYPSYTVPFWNMMLDVLNHKMTPLKCCTLMITKKTRIKDKYKMWISKKKTQNPRSIKLSEKPR
jgi:hypothetical protein